MKNKLLNIYYHVLAFFARKYLKRHKPYIIGINGSVGKTSCRMIIAQTLKQFLNNKIIYTSSKNFNGELGLSLSIFAIETWDPTFLCVVKTFCRVLWQGLFCKKMYDVIVLEYGIDRPKEMEFLLSIAKPQIGVFTAIDAVHSEQFGDPSKIAHEEVKMIKGTTEVAFLNANDTYATQLRDHIYIDTFTYQTEGHESKANIRFANEKFVLGDLEGTIGVEFDSFINGVEYKIHTNLIGKSNYGYIGVALAITEILMYKRGRSRVAGRGILNLEYELQPGRLSVFPGIEKSIIIDSSYNASPLSVRSVINTVYNVQQQLFPSRKMWLVLGDMRELGDWTEREHRLLASYVSGVADRVFLVGEYMNAHLVDELQKFGYDMNRVVVCIDALDAGRHIRHMLKESGLECLLVCKGSQNTIFLEETVKMLLSNPVDEKKLTRQSGRWIQKKSEFFKA
ncbi:MAG: hypothetical protein CO170_03585 [candidate division SR1 bacterium CG_4_9_14_3_um_filter_40_9]|nr:MAG: hypothetical protein CO170_03585 [candidate division SR1 bacterium CG_4_9_14_3_um_filter_40_9]